MFENENNKIRFAYPKGDTLGEIKENARRMNLNDMGDMHLVLANEGDLCLYGELIDGSKEDVKDLNSFNNIDLSDFEFPPLPDPNTVDLSLPSGSAAETILRKHVKPCGREICPPEGCTSSACAQKQGLPYGVMPRPEIRNPHPAMLQGWQCPLCRIVHAPHVSQCACAAQHLYQSPTSITSVTSGTSTPPNAQPYVNTQTEMQDKPGLAIIKAPMSSKPINKHFAEVEFMVGDQRVKAIAEAIKKPYTEDPYKGVAGVFIRKGTWIHETLCPFTLDALAVLGEKQKRMVRNGHPGFHVSDLTYQGYAGIFYQISKVSGKWAITADYLEDGIGTLAYVTLDMDVTRELGVEKADKSKDKEAIYK